MKLVHTLVVFIAGAMLAVGALAQDGPPYPDNYPFGSDGNADHPNGYDGYPGDHPDNQVAPHGGPGGNGFGSGNGGFGGDAAPGGHGGNGGNSGPDGGAGGDGGDGGDSLADDRMAGRGGNGGNGVDAGGDGGDGGSGKHGGSAKHGGDGGSGGAAKAQGGSGGNGGRGGDGFDGSAGRGGNGGRNLGRGGTPGRAGDGGDVIIFPAPDQERRRVFIQGTAGMPGSAYDRARGVTTVRCAPSARAGRISVEHAGERRVVFPAVMYNYMISDRVERLETYSAWAKRWTGAMMRAWEPETGRGVGVALRQPFFVASDDPTGAVSLRAPLMLHPESLDADTLRVVVESRPFGDEPEVTIGFGVDGGVAPVVSPPVLLGDGWVLRQYTITRPNPGAPIGKHLDMLVYAARHAEVRVFRVIALGAKGDVNADGIVDETDLGVVVSNYAESGALNIEDGDTNLDGEVDAQDVTNVLGNLSGD